MRPRVLLALQHPHEEIVEGVTRFAGEAGWTLERALSRNALSLTLNGPISWSGDGVLLDFLGWKELRGIRNVRQLPIVCRGGLRGPNVRQVHPDVSVGGRKVLEYFRGKGFRHFAAYDLNYYYPADTVAAFEDHVRAAGLDLHVLKPLRTLKNPNYARILKMVSLWVKGLPKPCALFVGELAPALVVLRACEESGVHIPEEIALVSNAEHTLACENTHPPLSTLAGEHQNVAIEMCRLLNDMLQGQTPPQSPVLITPSGVIERQSSNILAIAHLPTARAVRLVLTRCAEHIGVQELAQAVGVSPRSLHREFRTHLSMRPSEYIQKVRLEKARELLETTKDTLKKIADQTGYGSGQALYLAFKTAFGLTPGQHRRRAQTGRRTSAR